MTFASLPASPSPAPSRRAVWLCAGVIALAVIAAYANSLGSPMVFDDRLAILENPSIRQWSTAFSPPNAHVAGALGRPMVNFSLAVNYAVSGDAVWSYHALNVLLHAACAVALFAVARRALELPALRGRAGGAALPAAFALALLWALHPLQTESVTSIVQRNEIMMSLCVLAMLYGLLRADAAPRRAAALAWYAFSALATLLGMGCKETMVVAPLLALAFDRLFLAGAWEGVWRARHWYYFALAGSWLWLAKLVEGADRRGGTVGFDIGMSAWDYALTQCQAIIHYLFLSIWPDSLALDYGTDVITDPVAVAPQAVLLALLLAGTVWALARRRPAGFLGAWFFLLLAPSSSVLPLTTQTMAEHRMYLPLAAVAAFAAAGIVRFAGRRAWLPLAGALALPLLALTIIRNHDYRSAIAIWTANVRALPGNSRGHYNLGCAYYEARAFGPAADAFEAALRLDPTHADSLNNLGLSQLGLGQYAKAERSLRARIALEPDDAIAHYNLGLVLVELGRNDEAIDEFATAISRNKDYADARLALALALERAGQLAASLGEFQQAVALAPDNFLAHFHYANALFNEAQYPAAIAQYLAAVRIQPDNAEARNNYGSALLKEGMFVDAREQFETALRLRPDYAEARENLKGAQALVDAARPRR